MAALTISQMKVLFKEGGVSQPYVEFLSNGNTNLSFTRWDGKKVSLGTVSNPDKAREFKTLDALIGAAKEIGVKKLELDLA